MRRLSLALLTLVLWAGSLRAEIYKWIDKDGVVHYTDDLGQVPEKQRAKSESDGKKGPQGKPISIMRGTSAKSPAVTPPPGAPPNAPNGAPKAPDVDDQGNTQEYWQNLVKDTQSELAKSQQELEQLGEARRKNLESGPGMQQRSAEIAQEEKRLNDKIQALQKKLENIPEQARQAGAPPGWLR